MLIAGEFLASTFLFAAAPGSLGPKSWLLTQAYSSLQNVRQVMRFDYTLPEGQQFTNLNSGMLAVSPDGRQYIYVTAEGLYLRSLDDFNAKLIVETGTNPASPFFSPDGKWIGYFSVADSKLKKIAISGGAPVTLCDASNFGGGSWGADDRIVYAEYLKGIKRVSVKGGTPEVIVKEAGYHPQLLPDGKSVLFTSGQYPYKVVVQSLQSDERRALFAGGAARYISTGHIVYAVGNNLFAVPFDLKTLKATGGPVRVVEGVWRTSAIYTPHYAVSDSGTLGYIPAPTAGAVAQRTLLWVDRNGQEEPLAAPPNGYSNPRISPDGTRVALSIAAPPGGDIWIWDFSHRPPARLTFEKTNAFALWTPDSKRLAFWSAREGFSYQIYQNKCTWTKGSALEGIESKDAVNVCFNDARGAAVRLAHTQVTHYTNGDKVFAAGTGNLNQRTLTSSGKWSYTGGTGKFRGLKGGGTYKCKDKGADPNAGYTCDVEGEYTLPAGKK